MDDAIKFTSDSLIEFTEEETQLPKRHHWLIEIIIQLVTTKPLGAIGALLVLILIFVAVLAPVITYTGPNIIHGEDSVVGPSRTYFFGTDQLARDVYSRIIYGARLSLAFGIAATSLSMVVATTIGILSAFIGGAFDTAVQRVVDAIMAFPFLVIMLTVMAILGPGVLNIILAFAMVSWARSSRVIRSAVLGIRGSEYILAARATGCTQRAVILTHVLPNVFAPIMILATMGVGGAILAEASLSFLGFGIPPPAPSWGRMLSSDGLPYMLQGPWLAIFPGIAISIAVFGFNMLGDAVRDLLDPKLVGGGGGGKI
ncbi:MAG: ABC transporter permease [Deltaproteobacteria bacterium]|nr:ABC transporter permease [Deltaproteobacteria bacterium]